MWADRVWRAFRYVAAGASGAYAAHYLLASVNTGLWHPARESVFMFASILLIPVALALAHWAAHAMQTPSHRTRDAIVGALVFLSAVFVVEAVESLRDWHSLRYWRTSAEVRLSFDTDFAARYLAAADRQRAVDDRFFGGSAFEWIGHEVHAFTPDRPPDRILWGVQRVRFRTWFTSTDAHMTVAVVGTLSAAWKDVPFVSEWPPGLAGRERLNTVIMTEVWSRHQQHDGSMGWTLLDAQVSILPDDGSAGSR